MTSAEQPTQEKKIAGKGFWILITLFSILGITLIAAPNFLKSRANRQANTCVSNLMQIDGAKEQWALDNKRTPSEIPTWDDLDGPDKYLKEKLSCPSGGEYSINAISSLPACSRAATSKPPHFLRCFHREESSPCFAMASRLGYLP